MEEDRENERLEPLISRLGYRFRDHSLLTRALTHSSYANEKGLSPLESNERLEFLGDSVLEIVITTELYERFPELTEGDLTRVRAFLVRKSTLVRAAKKIGLGDFLLLGRGEEATGGRKKSSIMANATEALMGALYLDGGLDVARRVAVELLGEYVDTAVTGGLKDYKSRLQELVARKTGDVPVYIARAEGPPHSKTFHAEVRVAERSFGPGSGRTKKEAEQEAARLALKELGVDVDGIG